MEFFISIFILIVIKIFEWIFSLIKWSFKIAWWVVTLPFKLLGLGKNSGKKPNVSTKSKYSNPVDKAIDHWENKPEELDVEDVFWLDELIGDDK